MCDLNGSVIWMKLRHLKVFEALDSADYSITRFTGAHLCQLRFSMYSFARISRKYEQLLREATLSPFFMYDKRIIIFYFRALTYMSQSV